MGTHNGASALDTTVARVSRLSPNDRSDWVHAHEALSRLSRDRAALDAEEGRWLLRAWRSAAHVHLGYGSFAQYIESLFGYKSRTTQEKLRVAEALESLPLVASALESGALSWCAARELTRVALPETEPAWLDAARGKTVRELESLVASKAPGDTPDTPPTQLPRPRLLRFEVAPDTFATFREAMSRLRRFAGGSLDDDAILLAMARHVLGGPRDEGRSSYQISLNVCAACGNGAQPAAGELVPIDAAVVDMAACDAQHLGELLPLEGTPQAANENANPHVVPAADAEGAQSAASTERLQRSGHAHVDAPRSRKSEADTVFRATDPTPPEPAVGPGARVRPRAKQSIPPALRRAVLTRDRHRCRAPGCTHATFVDVHHVEPRAEGGQNEASNLLTLCGAHHRAVHHGELLIEREHEVGMPTAQEHVGGFIFCHADGAAYGQPVAPRPIDAYTKVFSALRHLGFREGEVKTVLSELRGDTRLGGASVERLLHEALCRIRPKGK